MEYVIGVVIVGVVIGVFVLWAKKEKEKLGEYVTKLTEEQKNRLQNAEIQPVEGKNNVWVQEGLIGDVKIRGEKKVDLYVLWYNKVIANDTMASIEPADIKMNKSEFDAHGLKVGDYVKIEINPEKEQKLFFKTTA